MTEPQYQHERTEPRRVKKGILIGEAGPECTGDSPASRLWLSVLERSSSEAKTEGLRWGTLGQAMGMVGLPGRIRVKVQGIRRQPHEVDLLVPVLSETVREMIVERLSEDPRNLVRIEEGGIPSTLVGLIRELGGRLVPTGADLSAELDEKPIGFEHRVVCAAAAAAQLLEQDLKPLLVAVGLPMDDLAVLLRDARAVRLRGALTAHRDPRPTTAGPDPERNFWRGRSSAEPEAMGPFPPLALLMRLGKPPLKGKFPMVGLLESIYRTVAEDVDRDRTERDEAMASPPDQP